MSGDDSADGPDPDDPDSDQAAGDTPEERDGSAAPETSAPVDQASDEEAPLSDLADRMRRQRDDRTDSDPAEPTPDLDVELSDAPPPDSDDDPFEQMSVGEIDEEALWSSLGDDDTAGVGVDSDTASNAEIGSLSDVGPVSGVESVGDTGPDAREHVVPKVKYCQSCPYLAEPPELACTHEGTKIVEAVDSERFRVRNCPMVESGVEPKK